MSLLKHVIAVAMLVTLTAGTAGGQEANYSREGADTCLACHENDAVLPLFKGPHANPTDPNGPFGPGRHLYPAGGAVYIAVTQEIRVHAPDHRREARP